MKVMRRPTRDDAQVLVGTKLGAVLDIVGVLFLWRSEKVACDCGNSSFNFPDFASTGDVALASHSWIDGRGVLRMAPPWDTTGWVEGDALGIGQAFYNPPVALVDPSANANASASFSSFFSFSIISVARNSSARHGMAFVVVPDLGGVQRRGPSTGGGLLLPESDRNDVHVLSNSSAQTLAVEFTKPDPNAPPETINSTNGAAVDPSMRFLDDAVVNYAWIDYNATTKGLDIRVGNTSDRPTRALLSTVYDLSALFRNVSVHVGFSSNDKLSVRSWNFSSGKCDPIPMARPAQVPVTAPLPATAQPFPPDPPPLLPQPRPRPPVASESGPRPLDRPPEDDDRHPPDDEKHGSWYDHRLWIYVGASGGCALFICVLLAVCCTRLWQRMGKYRGVRTVPDRDVPFAPQIFKYRTLSEATNGFDERALLGRGGYGSVYKGLIAEDDESTSVVAVKRIESKNDAQKERQFIAEISSIGRLRHRNLVQLLGWCHEKGDHDPNSNELLLVYEYMPNGSLDRLLFGATARVLSWESRYNIVRGVAAALAYLHGDWEKQVVHRDVKASNVLLDADFNPRLGDFGLARLIDHDENPKATTIAGTLGYLAPEITITGKATDRTDVYSFGALTLEVVCGRRPIERGAPPEEAVLVDWVWQLHGQGEMARAVDARLLRQRLPGGLDMEEVLLLLSLGLLCSHPDPAARPSMRQVLRMLDDEVVCPPVPDHKPLPPFSAFRPASDYYSTPTARAMAMAASRPSKHHAPPKPYHGRPHARVSDCDSL